MFDLATKDGRLQLPRWRAESLYQAAKSCLHLDGEFWECGVYRGGSAKLLAELARGNSKTLRLFDTFRGFSGVGERDRSEVRDGRMFYSENAADEIAGFLDYELTVFHAAPIPLGFAGLESSRIAFANIDVDLYRPTRDALSFIFPRMVAGGVIIVDDYNDPDWPGVAEAVNSFGIGGFSMSVVGTQARIHL